MASNIDPRDARMFVIERMDKVQKVIEENRKRKLTKHKKISNHTILEIDSYSPLEILNESPDSPGLSLPRMSEAKNQY